MESILIREFSTKNIKFYITADYHIEESVYQKIIKSDKFLRWVSEMEKSREEMVLSEIHIQSHDMFGPNLGFLKFTAHVKNAVSGRAYNSIVFMRGDAVAVLVILIVSGRKYIVVTKQPRIPVGQFRCVETCAGMIENGESDPSKVKVRAFKEMQEELHITIDLKKIVDLTSWAGIPNGILLSPGGCDERMRLFFAEEECSLPTLASFQGKATGDKNEDIITSVIPYESWIKSDDAKLRLCVSMYEQYRQQYPRK